MAAGHRMPAHCFRRAWRSWRGCAGRVVAPGIESRALPLSANTHWKRPTRYLTRLSASIGSDLAEELGDLLLQVLFYAQMGDEAGYFSIVDVLGHLNRKLIRRHPHVFGDEASAAAGNRAQVDAASATEAAGVLANWESDQDGRRSRRKGKDSSSTSLLDEVPRELPGAAGGGEAGQQGGEGRL